MFQILPLKTSLQTPETFFGLQHLGSRSLQTPDAPPHRLDGVRLRGPPNSDRRNLMAKGLLHTRSFGAQSWSAQTGAKAVMIWPFEPGWTSRLSRLFLIISYAKRSNMGTSSYHSCFHHMLCLALRPTYIMVFVHKRAARPLFDAYAAGSLSVDGLGTARTMERWLQIYRAAQSSSYQKDTVFEVPFCDTRLPIEIYLLDSHALVYYFLCFSIVYVYASFDAARYGRHTWQ